MEIVRKKIDLWDALVFTDKNEVCIALDGEGGAVVGGNNYKDVEAKFIEAMDLSESVKKLLYFKEFRKFPDSTKQ